MATAQSFDPAAAARLQAKLDSLRTANNIKGISACVIDPGRGTWKGAAGISHAGTPMTSDLEFGIASHTKLFTGVLILTLAEDSLLRLEDSLHTYLPAYANIDPDITIRQLLNHTSGLDDVTNVPGYPDSMLTNPNRIFTPEELMTWAGPPIFAAGTGWAYCNTNYLLAGMIAERATGQPYGQLLRDRILRPLDLDSTFLAVYDSIPYPVAHPWQGGMDYSAVPRTSILSAAWAAGAMYSTAGEMAQWYAALMNGRVITANAFAEMTTFVGSGRYGIGISEAIVLGRTVWQHGGNIWGGYNSFMLYDPATGIIVSVLTNQLPGQSFPIAVQLLSVLLDTPLSSDDQRPDATPVIVSPNPTTGLVHVALPGEPRVRIRIFSPDGQWLAETTQPRFSLAGYPDGLYFLQVQTAQGIRVFTVSKQE